MKRHVFWQSVCVFSWLGAVYIGYALFIAHGFYSPPEDGAPAQAPLLDHTHSRDSPIALVFVHPQCPCTRATLEELSSIVTAPGARLAVRIYFYAPESEPLAWVEGNSWRQAAAIPGAALIRDPEAQMARAFHAAISGTICVYAPDGSLLYDGGITASRGHAGPSLGGEALRAIARGARPAHRSAPVFGCLIYQNETV